jgi:hypothetical protein
MTQDHSESVRLAGSVLGPARHVCAFFYSPEEEYRVLLPFVKEGLEQGDKGFHIFDRSQHPAHLRRLQDGGIDVDRAQHSGQLEVRSWEEWYLQGGKFDYHVVFDTFRDALNTSRSQGFHITRFVAHPEWIVQAWPGASDWVEFESLLTGVLATFDDVVVCTYDLARYGGRIIMDVLRIHPVVIIGGRLHENPFYDPPEEVLPELRVRSSHVLSS